MKAIFRLEIIIPTVASPSPSSPYSLHCRAPIILKINPNKIQKNEQINPAIAIPLFFRRGINSCLE